jgi:hypothetical protein
MTAADECILMNGAARASSAPPRLSILVPFYRDNPAAFIAALAASPIGAEQVELIALDDGNGRADLAATVMDAMATAPFACTLIVRGANGGRAAARNRLLTQARGGYVLFADADMALVDRWFLPRWLRVIEKDAPAVAFGGFQVDPNPDDRSTALHAYTSARSDCLPAALRARRPAQTLTTSNLLVRRDVLNVFAFDSGFRGWGYEDSEWAFRVASRHPILHIDNPLRHLGLDSADALIEKYASCGGNFLRLVAAHPQAADDFAALRLARLMARMSAPLGAIAASARWLARDPARITPLVIRAMALKLMRAAVIAQALPQEDQTHSTTVENLA